MVLAVPAVADAQYYYDNNCTYHAYKLCVGNNVYWYSGCHQQQDLYITCSAGQTCQYGQCLNYVPAPTPIQPNYQPYFRTSCYNNSVYWYDSLGAVSGLNKNCNDNNSCTQDSCSNSACANTLNCNGSTCAKGSEDHKKYCPQEIIETPAPVETPVVEPVVTEPVISQPQPAASVSETKTTSGFMSFLKKWYMWILAILVIVFLFSVVFKRFSSEV